MYTLKWMGQEFGGTGTIRDTINAAGIDVGQNEPFVGGQQASFDTVPNAGATVTFRPRASGKAKNSGKRRGRK